MKFFGPALALITTFGLVVAGVLTGLGFALGLINNESISLLDITLVQKIHATSIDVPWDGQISQSFDSKLAKGAQ